MYKIIGGDAKEYGPISLEQMQQWIAEGRVNSQTKVQSDASPEWKALGEFPEFSGLLSRGTAAPPTLPTSLPQAPKTSAMAITSLVLGILGWLTLGLTALIGLILGIVALVRIRTSNGALRGTGIALAGTIVSGIFLLALPILAALLLPALAQAKAKAQSINCMNNMKQLALGALMYANDHKDQLPNGTNWCEAVETYVGNARVFQCPAAASGARAHYAFNEKLSGVELKEIRAPGETVLLFESEGGWNDSGGPDLVVTPGRHRKAVGFVFADGHVEIARESRVQRVRWDP